MVHLSNSQRPTNPAALVSESIKTEAVCFPLYELQVCNAVQIHRTLNVTTGTVYSYNNYQVIKLVPMISRTFIVWSNNTPILSHQFPSVNFTPITQRESLM